jgi:hypothetical protein
VLARSLDRMEGISGANAEIGFMKSTKIDRKDGEYSIRLSFAEPFLSS